MERARHGRDQDVAAEWAGLTGRPFGLIETFGMDDAEVAIVVIGSTAGNAATWSARCAPGVSRRAS